MDIVTLVAGVARLGAGLPRSCAARAGPRDARPARSRGSPARATSPARSSLTLWMRALSLAGVPFGVARDRAAARSSPRARARVALAGGAHGARRSSRHARRAARDRVRAARTSPAPARARCGGCCSRGSRCASRCSPSRSRRIRSIRGTRGRSGRPRRASGTSWAASSRSRARDAWFAGDGAAYFDAAPELSADGAAAAGLGLHRARPLGRHADELAVVAARGRARARRLRRAAREALARRSGALAGTWLVASLPLANVHVALAGYADLPLAAYYTGGRARAACAGARPATCATPRWRLLLAVACPLIKIPGHRLGAARSCPASSSRCCRARSAHRRVGFAGSRCSAARVLAQTSPVILRLPAASRLRRRRGGARPRATSCSTTGTCSGTARSRPRCSRGGELVAPPLAPLTAVVAGGVLFLVRRRSASPTRATGSPTRRTVNRATLHLAPLLVGLHGARAVRAFAGTTAASVAGARRADAAPRTASGLRHRRRTPRPDARAARRHARSASTPRTTRSRCARSRSRAGHPLRARAVPHRRAARRRRSARGRRGRRDRADHFARRLLALRAEVDCCRTSPRRTCCSCSGMATSSTPARGTRRSSTATTSAPSGSGTTTACASATAASRCARAACSRRCEDPRIALVEAEDTTIGRTFRPLLEREHGIRFGREALADRFSFEAAYPIGKPFGFHGLFNFCAGHAAGRARGADAPRFSDAIARSPQLAQPAAQLHRARAVGAGHRDRAAHAGGRSRHDAEARALLAQAGAQRGARRRRRPQRSLPLRQRQALQAVPRRGRARRAAPPRAPPPSPDALVARGNAGAPARRPRRRRARLSRGARDRARSPGRAALPRRDPLPAQPPRRRAAAARARGRARPATSRSSTTTSGSRSRPRTGPTRRSPRIGRRSRSSPTTRPRGTTSGSRCRRANRLPDAIDAFRHALALAPDFAQAHWNLGWRCSRTASSRKAGASTNGASSARSSSDRAHARPGRAGTARTPPAARCS